MCLPVSALCLPPLPVLIVKQEEAKHVGQTSPNYAVFFGPNSLLLTH